MLTLFGPPGVGKSTLGDLLEREAGFVHLALGRMLRNGTLVSAAGLEPKMVRRSLATGQTITGPALFSWLDREIEASRNPVVVDGYPREPAAIEPFNALVRRLYPRRPTLAVELVCEEGELRRRLGLRGRVDDSAPMVTDRLKGYRLKQLPLLSLLDERVTKIRLDAKLEPSSLLTRVVKLVRPNP